MITEDEIFDLAVRCAIKINDDPEARLTISCLQQLILDAYARGMHDAFQAAGKAIGIEPMKVSANA